MSRSVYRGAPESTVDRAAIHAAWYAQIERNLARDAERGRTRPPGAARSARLHVRGS